MNRVPPKIAASCQGHIPDCGMCRRVPARIEFQRQNSAFHRGPGTIAHTLVLVVHTFF